MIFEKNKFSTLSFDKENNLKPIVKSLRTPKNQKGFTLVSLSIGTIIASAIIVGSLWQQAETAKIEKAQKQGIIMSQIVDGLNGYITNYHDALLKDTDIIISENDPATGHTTERVYNIANKRQPTIDDLIQLGLLDNTVNSNNLYDGGYIMQVELTPPNCTTQAPNPNCNLEAVVAMTNPIKTTGLNIMNDAEKLAGFAIQKIGSQGGFTTSENPDEIRGFNGGWTFANPNNTKEAGVLAAKTNYTSSTLSFYLPRDGHLPMTGTLNMGVWDMHLNPDEFNTPGKNNSIKNVDRIEAREMELSQDLTVGRDLTVKRHIIAGNKDDLTYATFDFYGTTNIGNKDGNVSDMPLLNVFGRSVFGKQGQIYTGNANPLMTVLGDVNFGAQGQAPVQFNVFGDTNISRYLFVGDGTGMPMSNQTRNSDAARALIAGNGNDKVVLDVNGNAIIDQSLGIGKYLYTGNGIGVVSNITDASTGKGNNTNAIVDTANSVLDVNGNAVISKNLKVYGGAYINDYLYTGNGTGQEAKVKDNAAAVNAIGNNVVFEANGSANIGKNLAVGKYAYIGDGRGNGTSKIPGINKLTNVVLDVNGDLAVAKDSQFLGNMTIGTGGMTPDGGNKGNLYVTGNTDTYNLNVRNDLAVNRNAAIGGNLNVNGHTQLNSLKVLGQADFTKQVVFDRNSDVTFKGKVIFDQAQKPVWGGACEQGEFGVDAEGYQLVCKNGKWDWAEGKGNLCGIGFFKDPFTASGLTDVSTVVPCKNASQRGAKFVCPSGYKTSVLHISSQMIPYWSDANSSIGKAQTDGTYGSPASWAEMTGGLYRWSLFDDADIDKETQGYMGIAAGGQKSTVSIQADYSNFGPNAGGATSAKIATLQKPANAYAETRIKSLGKKVVGLDIYTNIGKDGSYIVTDDGRQLENLPKTIQGRKITVQGNSTCIGLRAVTNPNTGMTDWQCGGGQYIAEINSTQKPTTFTKVRKLKQGLDFAVMPMYMAQCVKE